MFLDILAGTLIGVLLVIFSTWAAKQSDRTLKVLVGTSLVVLLGALVWGLVL